MYFTTFIEKKSLSEYLMNVRFCSSPAFDFFLFSFLSYGLWFGKSFQRYTFFGSLFLRMEHTSKRIYKRTKIGITKLCDFFLLLLQYGCDRMTYDLLANKHWTKPLPTQTQYLQVIRLVEISSTFRLITACNSIKLKIWTYLWLYLCIECLLRSHATLPFKVHSLSFPCARYKWM